MRLRMLVSFSDLNPGDERDFERQEAIRLIDDRIAVPAGEKAEQATLQPTETRLT